MFTKIGITAASGAFPVLLWAGAAGAQSQSQVPPPQSQSQSQSQSTVSTPTSVSSGVGGSGDGTLARTGTSDLLPLALGGVALGGAVAVRRGLRRRSLA